MKQVGQGLTQKTYSYEPLGALVDIITNTAGKSKIFSFHTSASADIAQDKLFRLRYKKRLVVAVVVHLPLHLVLRCLSRCL